MANQNKDNERQRQGQQQPDVNQQKGGQKGGQIQDQERDRERQGNQGQQKGMRDQDQQREKERIERDIDDVQSVSGQQQDRAKQSEHGQRLDEVKGGNKPMNRDQELDQDRITQRDPQQGSPASKPNKQ